MLSMCVHDTYVFFKKIFLLIYRFLRQIEYREIKQTKVVIVVSVFMNDKWQYNLL